MPDEIDDLLDDEFDESGPGEATDAPSGEGERPGIAGTPPSDGSPSETRPLHVPGPEPSPEERQAESQAPPNEPLPEEVVVPDEPQQVPKQIAWQAEKALKRDDENFLGIRRADTEPEPGEPHRLIPDHLLTPEQEQEIRDFWGYTASEKSTRAERQVRADRMTGRGTASPEDLERAYELGYALQAAPFGAHPSKGREAALTTAWAKGVWQRQGELMPESKDPDMKAKLKAQLKGEQAPPKKRSGWD